MNFRPHFSFALSLIAVFYALASFTFWGIHYFNFQKAMDGFKKQRALTNQMREGVHFWESHKKDLAHLLQIGWFSRKNRLTAAEKIKQLNDNLILTNIIFEPEFYDSLDSAYAFNINKIKIDFKAFQEKDIYRFIDHLAEHFPGFFLFKELKESDQDGSYHGHLILDWVSFGAGNEEN